ncbi:choice-of-anchor A family protein [Luteolibacter sp. AS25]|uniref:choice-of-anchor A family protein n=1 Tax=Luteolibacter sp. AS25 TaxID=3135776 RepID=UPI00398B9125
MHPLPPFMGGLLALPLCAIASLGSVASAQSLGALTDYSVIVSGNLSTNSDIEGRTLVGGNLTSSSSANFGIKLQNQVSSSDLVLRVQGNIVSGNAINLNAGSLEIGGSTNGRTVNYNGGGSLVSNSSADYSDIISGLTSASQSLAMYTPNSTAFLDPSNPGQPGPFKLNATPDSTGLAVFSVNGADIFGDSKVQQIELFANSAADILINVAGTVINWDFGNIVGDLTQEAWRERVVWNFYEATEINFNSKNMMGQVLAPNATITTSGNIDGSVFAKNLITTSEVHLPGYDGNIVVPEPSSAMLMLLGSAAALLRRKR